MTPSDLKLLCERLECRNGFMTTDGIHFLYSGKQDALCLEAKTAIETLVERCEELERDAKRLDWLDEMGGGSFQSSFDDPVKGAIKHWTVGGIPRVIHVAKLWRSGLGMWIISRCTGLDFEDFEMEDIALSSKKVRNVIDKAMATASMQGIRSADSNESTTDGKPDAALGHPR